MATDKVVVDIITNSDKSKTSVLKFAAGVGVAVTAIKLLTDVGKKLIAVYSIQEQAEARLEQTIKATGQAAGFTTRELTTMASGLQQVTKFGDEAIIGAESLLLTFKDIAGDTFPRALESILDVSEAMGTDLQSATIQIGKALNDPILGLTALARSGIQFTEVQKDMIKGMVEMGDKSGAQAIILEELESQFGGVARAAADTATSALVQYDNALGDVKEQYGKLIAVGIEPFVRAITAQNTVIATYLKSLSDASDILEDINGGALTSGRSLEDLNAILSDLTTKRDIARGQVTDDLLEEIRVIEILIETYGTQDLFLTQAADSARVLAQIETEAAQKKQTILDIELSAQETLAGLRLAKLTEDEKAITLLQEQIDHWAQFRDIAGVQEILNELTEASNILLEERNEILQEEIEITETLQEKVNARLAATEAERDGQQARREEMEKYLEVTEEENDLLTEQDEIVLKLHEDTDVMFGTVRGSLELAINQIDEMDEALLRVVGSGMAAFARSFKTAGDAGQSTFDVLKKAGIAAISGILEAQGELWLVNALAELAKFNFPGAALWTVAAAGAFAASSKIQSFATGGEFVANEPTLFRAGEGAKPEKVQIGDVTGNGNSGNREFALITVDGGEGFWATIQRGVDGRQVLNGEGGAI